MSNTVNIVADAFGKDLKGSNTANKKSRSSYGNDISFSDVRDNIQSNNTEEEKQKKLEQLKKDVWERINSHMPYSFSSSSVIIDISDGAFERMLTDKEFMEESLSRLIDELEMPLSLLKNPACVILKIDQYRGFSCSARGIGKLPSGAFESKKSWWEKRSEAFDESIQERREYALNKKLRMKQHEIKRLNAEACAKKLALNNGEPLNYKKYMDPILSASELLDSILF